MSPSHGQASPQPGRRAKAGCGKPLVLQDVEELRQGCPKEQPELGISPFPPVEQGLISAEVLCTQRGFRFGPSEAETW